MRKVTPKSQLLIRFQAFRLDPHFNCEAIACTVQLRWFCIGDSVGAEGESRSDFAIAKRNGCQLQVV